MIEKVVRAICSADNDMETHMDHYRELAKAAIEAMRDPTHEMLYQSIGAESGYETWITMIDAALKED